MDSRRGRVRGGGAGGGGRGVPRHTSSSRSSLSRFTVENVLSNSSDIPSAQPRVPPTARTLPATRRLTSGGAGLPNTTSRTGRPMPSRTTKISEKLVLLPEADDEDDEDDDEDNEGGHHVGKESEGAMGRRLAAEEGVLLRDAERAELRQRKGRIRDKSLAERMPKMERRREKRIARVTAYCTAQAFKMQETAEFLRKRHEAKTKLYDDCLYVIYALPLLPGSEGYRVRSKPMLRTPGSEKTVLDLEMEQSELRDHHEGYFDEYDASGRSPTSSSSPAREEEPHTPVVSSYPTPDVVSASPVNRLAPEAKNYAEMLVFSYGVVVFWNFSEGQERDILGDLTFASSPHWNEAAAAAQAGGGGAGGEDPPVVSLWTRPLGEDEYETEEFHFEYRGDVQRPRVFNDMITLLPRSDHMVKLSISHAIAQSTKLCFFEERMNHTMLDAQHVPKALAQKGELNMSRSEVVKILGRLYKSRVDINLSSNILDVPNFFWDSEPTLHPIYQAVREYLEIDERIKGLNDRCRVFLDLAGILMDSIADLKMSNITWIIIVLIVVSIIVTVTEVFLRFAILEKERRSGPVGGGRPAEVGEPAVVANVTLYGAAGPIASGRDGGGLVGVNLQQGVDQPDDEEGLRDELKRIVDEASLEELATWKLLIDGDGCEALSDGELKR